MTDRAPSQTARSVALLRAAHLLLDAAPPVLDDTVVVRLIGADNERRIVTEAELLQVRATRALRAHIVLRSRFAEDRLAAAVERGVSQYVLLGAGFDTFSFRQPPWAHSLQIFEVDEAATQNAKRERLAAMNIVAPANVHFISVDFEQESLKSAFSRHGVPVDVPTFFSWLGVTIYLTEDAIDAVLHTVARFPVQSEIVLTFVQPRAPGADNTFARRAAEVGEPWRSYFEVKAMAEKLRAKGFNAVEFLSPDDARERYFSHRTDGLAPPPRTSIVSAMRVP